MLFILAFQRVAGCTQAQSEHLHTRTGMHHPLTAAGFDIECLCSRIRQPLPQIFGYELRAIVRTDMLWNAPSSP